MTDLRPPAALPGDLPVGAFVGEYQIEGVLGRGGMGVVYAACQPTIGARVAIKVLSVDPLRRPDSALRFLEEARAVNRIRHPHVVDIFAFGSWEDGRPYAVMEYLEGETLGALIARGPVPLAEARRLLLEVCEGLEAAHQAGIVHRDLKPENIWIARPKHGLPYAKILDFGVAKALHDETGAHVTGEGEAVGTPHYMAPEQCRGDAVDARTDIYALGVILYLMWSGHLPFEGSSYARVVAQQITSLPPPPSSYRPLSTSLEALILRCLEKNPDLRPASAQGLAHELRAVLPQDTGSAETCASAAVEKAKRGRRGTRRPASLAVWATATAAVLVVVGSALSLGAWQSRARTAPVTWPLRAPAGLPNVVASLAGLASPQTVALPLALARTCDLPSRPIPTAYPTAYPTAARRVHVRTQVAPSASLHVQSEPARPGARVPLEERGFLRENPFR